MSAAPATVRPLRRPAEAPRPHIEIVPTREQRRARPKVAYAVVGVAGIFVILLAQLLLSMAVSQGAYRISELQVLQREAERDVEELTEKDLLFGSTQYLAAAAAQLGMVSNTHQALLSLETGAVTGDATPASAADAGIVDAAGNLVGNALVRDLPIATGIATGTGAADDATPGVPADGTVAPGTVAPGTVAPGTVAPSDAAPSAGAAVPAGGGGIPSPVTR